MSLWSTLRNAAKARRDWDRRARENPRHYVCDGRADWSEEEFYGSGERSVAEQVLNDMGNVCQGKNSSEMRMLEIGCGAGRVTRALARHFGEVHAVDVSGEMVRLARAACAGCPNVFIYRNNGRDVEVVGDIRFDFAYSALRRISQPAGKPSAAAPILGDLRDTLHEFQRTHGFGRGIAAVQTGELWRVIYIEFEGCPLPLINPSFVRMSEEKVQLWDNCFSFPDLLVRVERSESVEIQFQDETGAFRALQASGALSELLQHELDHLDGVLAVDRAADRDSFCTKEEYERRYRTH